MNIRELADKVRDLKTVRREELSEGMELSQFDAFVGVLERSGLVWTSERMIGWNLPDSFPCSQEFILVESQLCKQ